MSWDHVPPKAILIEPNTFANTLFSSGELPTSIHHMAHFQNGIKYRTICLDCNNVVLGKNDEGLKEFIENVKHKLGHLDELTKDYIEINVQINKVLRAICGHFLAMSELPYDQNEVEVKLREYVLDETLRMDSIKLYSWFYPYKTILNVRNITVSGFEENTHPKGFISVMESFPLALMISSENESVCHLDDISSWSTNNIEDSVTIRLTLGSAYYPGTSILKQFNWPVNTSNEKFGAMFVLGNEEELKSSRIATTKK